MEADFKSDPSITAECLRDCQLGRSAAQDRNKEGDGVAAGSGGGDACLPACLPAAHPASLPTSMCINEQIAPMC